jgi:hypothetical protein
LCGGVKIVEAINEWLVKLRWKRSDDCQFVVHSGKTISKMRAKKAKKEHGEEQTAVYGGWSECIVCSG